MKNKGLSKMKSNKKKMLASILAMIGTSSIAQNNATGAFEASASIESFCQINAQDINFGVVNLPLTAQSANGQVNVLCSNNTSYIIDMNYGSENAVINPFNEPYYISVNVEKNYVDYQIKLQSTGVSWAGIFCYNTGGVKIGTKMKPYFPSYTIGIVNNDTEGLCSKGTLNEDVLNTKLGISSESFGLMSGALKGDKLAYKIMMPEDSTKTWRKGENSFKSIGSGVEQKFVFSAKIIPEDSSSAYVGQDTYIDTITTTISY